MKISESEARVMETLWEQHPKTSGEVVQAVSRTEDWSPKTIRTLLARLVDKGAVSRTGTGRGESLSEKDREEILALLREMES
jgi:predicted transcriptional regulator